MTAKEYLQQAFLLDRRITCKIEQLHTLNGLALKATTAYTGMPRTPNRDSRAMANTVDRIIDLQDEINQDIDELVELKARIRTVIDSVSDAELQLILEERYLNCKTWEEISVDLDLDLRHLFRLQKKALNACIIPQEE